MKKILPLMLSALLGCALARPRIARILARSPGLEARLSANVLTLAEGIGERHPLKPEALEAAAHFVELEFRAAGYEPESQYFEASGRRLRNVVAQKAGRGPALIIGAHYDSVPGSPGADDNASGTAVLLELARLAKDWPAGRAITFVAFTNEEALRVRDMGSYRFVRSLQQRGHAPYGMVCLEMLGYYDDRPGSQQYPWALKHFFPNRGNFVALVSNPHSRPLLHALRAPMQGVIDLPISSAVLPGFIGGIDRSDHVNFWDAGYRALMVSDTAFYRNPNYHLHTDVHHSLDYARMARLTTSLAGALATIVSVR